VLEALVRWKHPGIGLLLPSTFLDMAERTNLIKPLTQRVLELALRQVSDWREQGFDLAVAVNVSTRVLVDREFPARVAAALSGSAVPASRLKLEVTESALMADPALARSVLLDLSDLGIHIAIDDFGTGYSSLAYLADLPVSEVKIDRAFVSRMMPGSREEIIVSSTVELAHHLGLRAVAEGVEDLRLLPQLRTLGCDIAQGYAISRPLDPESATDWLTSSDNVARADPALRVVA
jgi:EAL domain-containing protein (putative c-di-GMP-specific phosphodiesterase class I)